MSLCERILFTLGRKGQKNMVRKLTPSGDTDERTNLLFVLSYTQKKMITEA